MKVTVTGYQAVAKWKWNLPEGSDDVCGICRVAFEGTCAQCRFPGDDCPVVVGECKHCFHLHCIADWLQSDASKGRCPMCRQVFREKVADAKKSDGGNSSNGGNNGGASSSGSGQASSSASVAAR